jgi:hypothetical protein
LSPALGEGLIVGTLQSDVARAEKVKDAGVTLVTVEVTWDRFEPAMGKVDPAYSESIRQRIAAFAKAGLKVQLDFGMQYPPGWIKQWPHARYVNQYGDAYIDQQPGRDVVNGVFNESIRLAQAAHVAAVFRELGTDFAAVRLGWNYFGELGYPAAKFKDRTNCYWAFDELAQDQRHGLAKSLKPNPRKMWKPGGDSHEHRDAKLFLDWYLGALVDYQQFQITTVRRHYAGRLVLLYGSWGIRQAMLVKEVARDLGDGSQTELSLGYDFERLVNAIEDKKVAVCTTWIDANPEFGDDPPVAALARLVQAKKLELWAENTGKADLARMKLSIDRAEKYGVSTLVWAFEPDLFDQKHASVTDLKSLLSRERSEQP